DQSRVPPGASRDGADPVELVPALRPQPADLRQQHLLRQARRLPKGHAIDLPHARKAERRLAPASALISAPARALQPERVCFRSPASPPLSGSTRASSSNIRKAFRALSSDSLRRPSSG